MWPQQNRRKEKNDSDSCYVKKKSHLFILSLISVNMKLASVRHEKIFFWFSLFSK